MKLEPGEWYATCGDKKLKVRADTEWVSYRVASREVTPIVMKKLDIQPGVEISLLATNGNTYFTNRPAPVKPAPAVVPAKKAKAKAKG